MINKSIRQVSVIASAALFSLQLSAQAPQTYKHAGEYIDYINKQMANVNKKYVKFQSTSAHSSKERKARRDFNNLLEEVQKSEGNIRTMPPYNSNRAFRDSAAAYFKLYNIILQKDYNKVVDMQEIADQSYDLMEAYFTARDIVSDKLASQSEMINVELKKFGAANNVNIIEGSDDSDIGKMMKKIGEVNHYYDPIYLNFFKVYKQYAYLSDALASKNVGSIEQNKNTLQQFATEALTKINSFGSFKGDNSLVTSSKKLIENYLKFANEKVQPQLDFLIADENFKKLDAEMKKKTTRTKADIDNFNNEVANFNKLVAKSNEAGAFNNNVINPSLDNFNKAVANFFSSYIPVY
ncbi:LIC11966 family surface protein [Polluticaenibacter yanchengensis]|uniref:DUF3829 domain-containing protein n=1 Tax=Polluticaenibacter yanchengensis TaxID=3014562 RepID=A0ABT4UHX9_9BACT|nr:hypothetical protein [Chitinophagaceae bacterium LY-5]